MSYTDPQQTAQNPMAASVARSVKKRDEAIAANATGPDPITTNLTSLVQGGVNMLTEKKKALNKLNKSVLQEDQKIYDKIGGFTTAYEGFDAKSEAFFGELIEKYNTIKTHLNNGSLRDVSLGQKDLANIKNIVDQYGAAIPKVLAMADEIDAAAKIAGEEGVGDKSRL